MEGDIRLVFVFGGGTYTQHKFLLHTEIELVIGEYGVYQEYLFDSLENFDLWLAGISS